MPKIEAPPLARYTTLIDYVPHYGDFVIWAGWFTQWFGVVSALDRDKEEISIIFEGSPFLLFTLLPSEHVGNTKTIKLSTICNARKGSWAILRNDTTLTWFV